MKNQLEYKGEIQQELLSWYHAVKRDLPWRKTKDPYKIWISEVMLQQTLVETVKGYYERFLEAFPTVEALAEADDEKLMKLWEGLGYYSRARNLKKAAYLIVNNHNGIMPKDQKTIQKLPGIGPYTSGAILSIAYDVPVAAVDGNVIRVYSRLFRIEDFVDSKEVKKQIETIAESMVDSNDPSGYNQSLMELGATVCKPQNPKCLICPIRSYCHGYEAGIQDTLPKKMPKKEKKQVAIVAGLIQRNDQFLIVKRPPSGLLPDLWSLPSIEMELQDFEGKEASATTQEAIYAFEETLGIQASAQELLGVATHVFTHIKWHIHVYAFEYLQGDVPEFPECVWIGAHEIDNYAFPTAFKKALKAGNLI